MVYMYFLGWISMLIQVVAVTLSISAGLFYLAELVEEYASIAKKVIKVTILIDTALSVGLLLFEDLPFKLIALCVVSNVLYAFTVRSFPLVELYSPAFAASIIVFLAHNYMAFEYFAANYYQFQQVLCYMTLFCWLIPIGLLVSCSANDNVLPMHQANASNVTNSSGDVVTNYFKGKGQKVGLLSLMRYCRENYLPQVQSRKKY